MMVVDMPKSALGPARGFLFDETEYAVWREANPDAVVVSEQPLKLVIVLVEPDGGRFFRT